MKLLESFSPVSLADLDVVSLLHRVDSKYLLSLPQLERFLSSVAGGYQILTIDGRSCFCYRTLYYDTDRFSLYHDHHNGKRGRYKVRAREYIDSGLCFDEVKFKDNRGKTHKYRARRGSFSWRADGAFTAFVRERFPLDPALLAPRVAVTYNRFTFTDIHRSERMTVDTGVVFHASGGKAPLGDVAIVELKQERGRMATAAALALRELRIRCVGCSKYCLGVVSLCEGVKKNRFKNTIRYISKLSEAA